MSKKEIKLQEKLKACEYYGNGNGSLKSTAKEFGILRAIGASGRDVVEYYLKKQWLLL